MFSTNLGIMFAVKGRSPLPFRRCRQLVMVRWPVPPVPLHAPLSLGLSPSRSEPIMFAVKGRSPLPFCRCRQLVMVRWPVPPVPLHAPLSPGLSPSRSEPIPTAYYSLQTVLALKCLGLVAIAFKSRLFRGLLSCLLWFWQPSTRKRRRPQSPESACCPVGCTTLYRARMLHLSSPAFTTDRAELPH
jgi:hypothetical protein